MRFHHIPPLKTFVSGIGRGVPHARWGFPFSHPHDHRFTRLLQGNSLGPGHRVCWRGLAPHQERGRGPASSNPPLTTFHSCATDRRTIGCNKFCSGDAKSGQVWVTVGQHIYLVRVWFMAQFAGFGTDVLFDFHWSTQQSFSQKRGTQHTYT